ncbi:MAG: hypothetical protein V1775_12185 [Bacteroidota bacterium]
MNPDSPVVMVVARDGCRSMFAASEHSLLREEISRRITFPDFARDFYLEGVVNVKISTNNLGQVSVYNSTGTHPGLLRYVIECLNRMTLMADDSKERQYMLMLKFILY